MVELKLAAKVGKKGQVVIPKTVRDLMGIGARSDVLFSVQDNRVIIEKKSPVEVCEEFFTLAQEHRIKWPKHVDWDELYYSQYER